MFFSEKEAVCAKDHLIQDEHDEEKIGIYISRIDRFLKNLSVNDIPNISRNNVNQKSLKLVEAVNELKKAMNEFEPIFHSRKLLSLHNSGFMLEHVLVTNNVAIDDEVINEIFTAILSDIKGHAEIVINENNIKGGQPKIKTRRQRYILAILALIYHEVFNHYPKKSRGTGFHGLTELIGEKLGIQIGERLLGDLDKHIENIDEHFTIKPLTPELIPYVFD